MEFKPTPSNTETAQAINWSTRIGVANSYGERISPSLNEWETLHLWAERNDSRLQAKSQNTSKEGDGRKIREIDSD
jgi:hypothetical protein